MRIYIGLPVVASISAYIVSAAAYKERGGAERALIYYAYSLEGLVIPSIKDDPPPYTIAKGCQGSADRGRCTLWELMAYIWGPERGQTHADRPTKSMLPKSSQMKLPLEKLVANIAGWKKGKLIMTGNLDTERAVSQADYYAGLSKLGDPIGSLGPLIGRIEEKDVRDLAEAHYKNGMSAGKLTYGLRIKEVARLTVTRLKKATFKAESGEEIRLDVAVEKVAADPDFKGYMEEYSKLDIHATARNNPRLSKDPEVCKAAIIAKVDEILDAGHVKALEAARVASERCTC